MPVFGLETSVPNANRIMAQAFLRSAEDVVWPEICGSYVSTRVVEPIALNGAVPPMRIYQAGGKEHDLNSYFLQSPQNLLAAWLNVSMYDLTYDQTGSVQTNVFAGMGRDLVEWPDYALGSRILNGHTTTAITGEDGVSYNATIDGVPFFSAAHTWKGVTTQSNIISGVHPSTAAAWIALDLGTQVNEIIQNHNKLVKAITELVDDQGVLQYRNFDASKSLVYWMPSYMAAPASISLVAANGTVGGIASGSSGSTTLPTGRSAKAVRGMSMLQGTYDPFAATGSVSPTSATAYYAFIVDRAARPFYMQTFRPAGPSDFLPKGYNPSAVAQEMVAKAGITEANANLFANAIINTNLRRIGEESDRDTAKRRQFFFQPVVRGQMSYGWWPTAFKIVPTGTST